MSAGSAMPPPGRGPAAWSRGQSAPRSRSPRQPALVGRRRPRLPGRARRVPRRRRLRLVPGAAARGRRRACSAHVAGRRPRARGRLRRGAVRAAGWPTAGRDAVALDLSAGMLRQARAADARSGVARAAGPGRRLAPPLRRRHASTSPAPPSARCRSWPTPAAVMAEVARVLRPGRAVGVLGQPPDALDLPRRPRRGRAYRHAVLLRPHAVRRGRRRRPHRLRRAPPHDRRPGRATWSAAGLVLEGIVEPEWPADLDEVWGQWSPLRGALFPGRRSSGAAARGSRRAGRGPDADGVGRRR